MHWQLKFVTFEGLASISTQSKFVNWQCDRTVDMDWVQQNPGDEVDPLDEVAKMLVLYAPEINNAELTVSPHGAY